MSDKSSSTDTPTMMITDTGFSGSQTLCMLPVIFCFVGPPINRKGGVFTAGTVLSASVLSFVNITTFRWYATSFNNYEFPAKDTFVDGFPHHCPYTIMWLCFITISYHTPKLYFLAGAI